MAAQEERIARAAFNSNKKSIFEQSESSVQIWAEDTRSTLARRHERDLRRMKDLHEWERQDLESKIKIHKAEKDAEAKRQINKLNAMLQSKFTSKHPNTSTAKSNERYDIGQDIFQVTNSDGETTWPNTTAGVDRVPNPFEAQRYRAAGFYEHQSDDRRIVSSNSTGLDQALGGDLVSSSFYGDQYSRTLLDTLAGDSDLCSEAQGNQRRFSTPSPASVMLPQKRTPASARRGSMIKSSRVSTPLSTPYTVANSRYRKVENDLEDSSSFSTISPPQSTARRQTISNASKNSTPLGKHPKSPTMSELAPQKRSRSERFSDRQMSKEQEYKKEYKKEYGNDPVNIRDTVTRFGINFISYNPTEDPEDTTLETSWRRHMYLDLNMNLVEFQFEPHDGVRSCASDGPLLVLDNKWNGNAFHHLESGRFEIYKKSGQRLRIQFQQGEIEDFVKRLQFAFSGLVTSSESDLLSLDKEFTTERAPSHVNHLL